MNLVSLYRDHPELALLLDADHPHLVACRDCGLHYPPGEMKFYATERICDDCFDRRQDIAWQDWFERLAKEGREWA